MDTGNHGGHTIDTVREAKGVFDTEIDALNKTRDALGEDFEKILSLVIHCEGKVIVTGMGKPGHIASKIAATFSSLGTPSFYLHPAEALHGDLGMVSDKDVVIVISYSGESDEIVRILPNIKMIGATVVGITGNGSSSLAKASDYVQILPQFEEAGAMGLAPTSSTTAALCYGDSLAIVASLIYGFKDSDFAKFHPAGALGKKLLYRVDDLMVKGDDIPYVTQGTTIMDAVPVMTAKRLGLVVITDENRIIKGLLTDGDLRKVIERRVNLYEVLIDEVMTKEPKTVTSDVLAVDALKFIKETSINNLPVIDGDRKLIGAITWQHIVKAGIVV